MIFTTAQIVVEEVLKRDASPGKTVTMTCEGGEVGDIGLKVSDSATFTGGEKVIAPLNDYIRRFAAAGNPVFLTRDWHPDNHLSFRGHGGVWPPHCVADTPGGSFSPE